MLLPTISLRIERWKFNKDYGIYVSTLGNFKDRYKRRLPIKINQQGYCMVKTEAPKAPWKLTHRMVMLTWKPIPDAENLTVDHLNHNKRDNSVNNLEWVTEKENLRRAANDLLHLNSDGEEKPPKTRKMTLAEYQSRILGYDFNGTLYQTADEIWEEACKIYKGGYSKKIIKKKISDLYTRANTTGSVKIGKQAKLSVVLKEDK